VYRDGVITPQPAAMALAAALAGLTALMGWQHAEGTRGRAVEAGFWFEDVSFHSSRIGGALTRGDLSRVHDIAVAELAEAFDGLRIGFTSNRRARYHVRVVQSVRDARMKWPNDVAGQSRGVAGFGGGGVVNFTLLASGAVVYASDDLDRAGVIDAIGRGVGRSAAHELAHQLLPHANLHRSRNRGSYEYYAASRPEQYYGAIAWDLAGPLLRDRYAAR
jgi:hypothetical protein